MFRLTFGGAGLWLVIGLSGCSDNLPRAPQPTADGHGKVLLSTYGVYVSGGRDCLIDWGDGTVTNVIGNAPDTDGIYRDLDTHTYAYNGSYEVVLNCVRQDHRWLPHRKYTSRANINSALDRPSTWGLSNQTITAFAALLTAILALLSFLAGRKSRKPDSGE